MVKSKRIKTKVKNMKDLNQSYERTIDSVAQNYQTDPINEEQLNPNTKESKKKQKRNRQSSETSDQIPISQEQPLSGVDHVNRSTKPRGREPELTQSVSSTTVYGKINTSDEEESEQIFYIVIVILTSANNFVNLLLYKSQ